jgi:hypothetical protein
MNRRLFFLNHDGWFEHEMSGGLLSASHDELVLWAYAMMERKNYRNYLITENPGRSLRALSVPKNIRYEILDAGY